MELQGKVVLITGASEGIGAACAESFRRRGSLLSLTARSADKLQQVAGGDALVVAGDLTDEHVRRRVIGDTFQRYGRIDVLVNNAGQGIYRKTQDVALGDVRRIFELNLWAALDLMQQVIPIMRRQGEGTIVNVSSIGGVVPLPWLNTYCASKFALGAITDSLRMELAGTGVHVMSVCPGYVQTGFQQHALGDGPPKSIRTGKRFAIRPEQCAEDLVRGVQRRARTVMSPASGWLLVAAYRLFPWLVERRMARMNQEL